MANLGIDFGTTNTVIVCHDRGRYPVVPHLAQTSVGTVSKESMPSLVVYDREEKRLIFGSEAERCIYGSGAEERYGVLPAFKRSLRDYADNARVGTDLIPGGFGMSEVLEGFAAAVLKSVQQSGMYPEDEEWNVVLTWPANANGAQRYVTRQAFTRAGFNVVSGLNEPSAAAIEFADRLAHGNRQKARQQSATVAVFDMGGGTFDASLVKVEGLEFNVLDSAGIERLGGDDFDEVLVGMFVRKLKVDVDSLRPFQRTLLKSHARQQKESISGGAAKSLTLSPRDLGLKGRVVTVSVTAYFKELRTLLDPAVELLRSMVEKQTADGSLSAIYLVGGSAKLPLISTLLSKQFPKIQLIVSDKPYSSTAMGAAIYQGERVRLRDILGRTFGVMRLADYGQREYFSPIFPAGMPLPQNDSKPSTHAVEYSPQHNIGRLRYLECATVDSDGRPAQGIRHWSETVFPYDPSIPVGGSVAADEIIDRPDLEHAQVRETYSVDSNGVITVNIERCSDGQALSCEIFRA